MLIYIIIFLYKKLYVYYMKIILFVIIYVLHTSMIWYSIFIFAWRIPHPVFVFNLYKSILI